VAEGCYRLKKSEFFAIFFSPGPIASVQEIRNQSENDDIPQEPENLRFAPFIIYNFYFAFLIDIVDKIIVYSP